jgi:glycosyltransferase involved in cell wall biosynthesis
MTNPENRFPILWALGRKGFITLHPLLTALNQDGKALAVTSTANVYLQTMTQSDQLLYAIEIPTNRSSLVKFFCSWYRIRKELIKALRENASVIHVVMSSPWDIFFLSAARQANCPILLTIHDAQQHLGEESTVMDAIRKWTIAKTDHIAVLSDHVKEILQKNLQIQKPIHVTEGGILSKAEPALPARLFPVGRPLKLLFHGRIHAYKGLDLLLDALLELQKKGHHYGLTIAGSGDLASYRSKLEELEHVTIHNYFIPTAEMLDILQSHDVVMLPYLEASQSGVALDALWGALPSIATPVGALPKQLKHGVDTLMLETLSATELAAAIHQLCTDKQLYEALSLGAYNSYQSAGPAKAAKQWNSLYADILNNKWKN